MIRKTIAAFFAATVCASAFADAVSASASLAFDSKYLSYGFVDNKDPILTPGGELTFFDTLTIGVEALFDTTKYGRKAGYGNRGGKYIELHPYVGISHAFTPEEVSWLPTTVELGLDWLYEYQPSAKARHGVRDRDADNDTQFWTFSVGLPDLWLEPSFSVERDVIRDNGTYANVELGHTFALIGGEGEDAEPVLSLRPSVAQGFGNAPRVRAYASDEDGEALDHAGLMDTMIKLELTWAVCEHVELGGYVGYSDFLFDRSIRHGARDYEARGRWEESWNFIGGLALSVNF